MSRPVNVVIPMAGRGKRFRRAGYETYKPFLPIFGKPMIQYVLESFPAHLRKFVLADRDLLTADQVAYLEAQPGVVMVYVPSHDDGPAYSIISARGQLPLDESCFIAYCDICWTWNYSAIEPLLDCDGIVLTRRQFHPHLVGNNYSAFCLAAADDPDRLVEIREKSSFTDDWMSEPLSIGAFYVKNGHAMIAAIEQMIRADERVSGEFFPSLLFNALVAAGAEVRLSDVDFFVHWGVPAQLEDVRSWVVVCRRLSEPSPAGTVARNVCCMGGAGVRMQHVTTTPKALMPMESGEPMFRYVAARFGADINCFIVNHLMAPRLEAAGVSPAAIIDIGEPTSSQLETLERAATFMQRQEQFLLTSCDAFGLFDPAAFKAFLARVQPDAVVFTFEPTLLQQSLGSGHTYVHARDGSIVSVHIKHRPDDEARGLAGFFWFRDGSVFGDLADISRVGGHEPCADHILKQMVERGDKVAAYPLDAYLHLGSPAELNEFAFWQRYYRVFESSMPPAIPPVSNYIAS